MALQDEHGYAGGYEQVRRYVRRHRPSQRVTFIPLSHDPGQRLECDFGHIHVDFPNGRRRVPVFVAGWAYSNCPFTDAGLEYLTALIGLRKLDLRFTQVTKVGADELKKALSNCRIYRQD